MVIVHMFLSLFHPLFDFAVIRSQWVIDNLLEQQIGVLSNSIFSVSMSSMLPLPLGVMSEPTFSATLQLVTAPLVSLLN